MSTDPEASTEAEQDKPAAKPKRKQFTPGSKLQKLPADHAVRQGKIALVAWNALGREAALQFLNDHDDEMGGRPLEIATDSTTGFDRVERMIAERARTTPLD